MIIFLMSFGITSQSPGALLESVVLNEYTYAFFVCTFKLFKNNNK